MDPSRMRCPHCGSTMLLRSADGIYKDNPRHAMLYVCKQYPKCDTYVRTHPGTTIPVGTPANRELRLLRNEAHKHFDRLYLSGMMSKQDAIRHQLHRNNKVEWGKDSQNLDPGPQGLGGGFVHEKRNQSPATRHIQKEQRDTQQPYHFHAGTKALFYPQELAGAEVLSGIIRDPVPQCGK